jgi:hypothetical protein
MNRIYLLNYCTSIIYIYSINYNSNPHLFSYLIIARANQEAISSTQPFLSRLWNLAYVRQL